MIRSKPLRSMLAGLHQQRRYSFRLDGVTHTASQSAVVRSKSSVDVVGGRCLIKEVRRKDILRCGVPRGCVCGRPPLLLPPSGGRGRAGGRALWSYVVLTQHCQSGLVTSSVVYVQTETRVTRKLGKFEGDWLRLFTGAGLSKIIDYQGSNIVVSLIVGISVYLWKISADFLAAAVIHKL